MTTSTRPLRYMQRKLQSQNVREKLITYLDITPDEMFEIQLEYGYKLLDEYLPEATYTNIVRVVESYKTQLLTDESHAFWDWFINQKQLHDAILLPQLAAAYGDWAEKSVILEEYKLELLHWVRDTNTHNKLRHFLSQSQTLLL